MRRPPIRLGAGTLSPARRGTALVVVIALARIMPSQPTETLVPPTRLSASKLEYSVHRPSRLLRRDIELVFRPDLEVRAALCPVLRECL